MRRFIIGVLFFVLPSIALAQSNAEPLHKFFAEFFEEQLRDQPEFATATGHHDYDDRWVDLSKSGRDLHRSHMQQRLTQLNRFATDGLPEQDGLSVRLLGYQLQQRLDSYDLETYLLRVSQVYGLHNRIYQTIDRMPARTVHDYENIIARLHAVPAYVDQDIALLNEAIQRGYTQPHNVIDLVEKQMEAQIAQTQASTALLIAFRRFPSGIPKEEQTRLQRAAIGAYENEFLPAWRKLYQYFDITYKRSARPSAGLGSIADGRAAYALLVRLYTTTNMTPEEIHKLGEAEVARIELEMKKTAGETGFNGTLEEFDAKLNLTPEQHFHSKDEMLVYCRNAAKIIEPELPALFRHIPKMLYGVRAIPEDREAATPTNAQAPTPDGSMPGWFNLNTYQPEKQLRSDKEALVLHEAIPGHIFQGSLATTLSDIPEFRKFYGNSAYAEGWALYAESLGAQLGVYRDPYSRYGQLSSERFRAVRLVVDTGIHAMGWTREQAVEYFRAHCPEESLAEVDRYIAWPGQALSYKIGQLKILELRRQAEQRLGAKFDIRDFHDVILRNGVLPMELLQEQGQRYIESAK